LIPDRIAPQLATLVSSPPTGAGWAYEIKLDGYRILARIDGEVVVMGDNGIPDFNALQNAFDGNNTDGLTYFVFDVLYLNGEDLRPLQFRQRRALLEELFHDYSGDVRLSQTFNVDGASMFESARRTGLEGIIAKRLDAPYRGTRTDTWRKIKSQLRQEFVVAGYATRAGAGKEVGTLMLGVYDDEKRLRYAGSVGTGWNSDQAVTLLDELTALETAEMPFDPDYPPTRGRWSRRSAGGEHWVKPTMVVEVSFVEWTPDGHIRHPTFRGIRRDKKAGAVRRELSQV